MATAIQSSPSLCAATVRRLPPSALSTHGFQSLRLTGGYGEPPARRLPLAKKSRGCITAKATKFSNGRYVSDDYLVKKLSAKEVQDLVKGERSVPLIVDFYATWCGPCILMAQELEMLAVEYESDALFIKVDTDDEYEFAQDMQVRGLPTLYFISPDPKKDAIRTEGLIPKDMIKNIIDNEM